MGAPSISPLDATLEHWTVRSQRRPILIGLAASAVAIAAGFGLGTHDASLTIGMTVGLVLFYAVLAFAVLAMIRLYLRFANRNRGPSEAPRGVDNLRMGGYIALAVAYGWMLRSMVDVGNPIPIVLFTLAGLLIIIGRRSKRPGRAAGTPRL